MYLFLKLVLAHLIADFILQFEELYRLKIHSRLGHFYHAGIHALVSLLIAFPYIKNPRAAVFIIVLAIIHLLQDFLKYYLQAKDPKRIFIYFYVDQIVHILMIAGIFTLPEAYNPVRFPGHPALDAFYSNNEITLFLIVFLTSAFAGAYLLHNFRLNYFKNTRPEHFITTPEMIHGIIERPLITFAFIFGGPVVMALTPLAGLPRFFLPKAKSGSDFLMNYIFAAGLGIIFRKFF